MSTIKTIFLLVLVNLSFLCNACPRPSNYTGLQRRQCTWDTSMDDYVCNDKLPTAAQIVARMRDPTWEGSVREGVFTFFYSNLASIAEMEDYTKSIPLLIQCIAWLRARGVVRYHYADNAVGQDWYEAQVLALEDNAHADALKQEYGDLDRAQDELVTCYSQCLSLAVVHPEVILFTRQDQTPLPHSVWTEAEFWPMTRDGGQVERIWSVDPRPQTDPTKPCPQPKLLWLRGRDPPVPQGGGFKCAITTDDGSIPGLVDPFTVQYPQRPPPDTPPTQPFELPLPAVAPLPQPPVPVSPAPPPPAAATTTR